MWNWAACTGSWLRKAAHNSLAPCVEDLVKGVRGPAKPTTGWTGEMVLLLDDVVVRDHNSVGTYILVSTMVYRLDPL